MIKLEDGNINKKDNTKKVIKMINSLEEKDWIEILRKNKFITNKEADERLKDIKNDKIKKIA